MQPNRDTKAELNHRGEVCEALADTGISRRVKWTERRVTLPLDLAPEASAPLLGYTLKQMVEHQGSAPCIPVWKTGVYLSTPMLDEIGIPCWNCTNLCGFAGRRLNCSANGIDTATVSH